MGPLYGGSSPKPTIYFRNEIRRIAEHQHMIPTANASTNSTLFLTEKLWMIENKLGSGIDQMVKSINKLREP